MEGLLIIGVICWAVYWFSTLESRELKKINDRRKLEEIRDKNIKDREIKIQALKDTFGENTFYMVKR